jgi:tRNA(Ile)-lysidine synthase
VPEPAAARPLDAAEFAALIGRLGPFERRPRLAVAVSGGPDSMCLCLLADRWARARGGEVSALIVDHGLRPTSATEARQVAKWLSGRRVDHHILIWSDAKPATGVQAAAREARYRLLGAWCRSAGVLHLLLGHHLDDQAETVALRRARQSGADGLAAMAAVRELSGLRLLRPLLPVPKARLLATLARAGQPWLDDPSNRTDAFARNRLRRGGDRDSSRLARYAAKMAGERVVRDWATAVWLVHHVRIDPAGFATLARAAVAQASGEILRRALQQVLMSVGGGGYPPRQARLAGLLEQIRLGLTNGRTLAGCRILRWREALLICREPQVIDDVATLVAGTPVLWDGRFRLALAGDAPRLEVRALAHTGVRQLGAMGWPKARRELPAPVRPSLPSVWADDELLAVPPLGLIHPRLAKRATIVARFQPTAAVGGAPFHAHRPAGATTLLRHAESLC